MKKKPDKIAEVIELLALVNELESDAADDEVTTGGHRLAPPAPLTYEEFVQGVARLSCVDGKPQLKVLDGGKK